MPAHPTEATPAHPVEATWDDDVRAGDPLRFPGYERPEAESVLTGRTRDYAFVVGRFDVLGGSMGSVVGEKVTRAAERALAERRPLVLISTSGGARMQEGVLSLLQMGKIAAALSRLAEGAIPYLSVMADPTTGGVTASYAMLGDLNVAEPNALIGFAGPRVIEQTIRQTLPEGFQRSDFLLEHGMLDFVVDRSQMKETLVRCLNLMWS